MTLLSWSTLLRLLYWHFSYQSRMNDVLVVLFFAHSHIMNRLAAEFSAMVMRLHARSHGVKS